MNRTERFAPALTVAGLMIALLVVPAVADASVTTTRSANLMGSPSSMERQHEVAVAEAYNFLETPADVRAFAKDGRLVPVTENADIVLANVSFPYAQPEVRQFIERIAAEYHAALGEKLVVTSLMRPASMQPSNAHELSVHPAGMAVDFRVPARAKARVWLERALLELENTGVLDVTRERMPPHYHVAVYPAAYRAYAEGKEASASAGSSVAAQLPTLSVTAPVVAAATVAPSAGTTDSGSLPNGSQAGLVLAVAASGLGVLSARRRSSPRTVGIRIAR